ncbi:uncharacterized protein VP01_1530g3 [Puccinia sorghi]|uniref:Uncharacterized protein n=1 Tax=Puccinia sorghi TaxID=27349 RepID=A0A0L6VKE6_9BASI|nr:uncharacterized protein VP01_1530g3 [Puccinia sorghi]
MERTFHQGCLQREQQLLADYFVNTPKHLEEIFHCQFWMQQLLFLWLMKEVVSFDEYFVPKINTTEKLGFSPHQKMIAVLRMLAYRASVDYLDEYTFLVYNMYIMFNVFNF